MMASVVWPAISHAGPVGQLIEDIAMTGGRGAGYQANHDSDNAALWWVLFGILIFLGILVSVLRKKR